jgi:teichuronic acid biosynthesis glycosyltransferase TuaG
MQKNNRISVITTLFNYGNYIEDCIHSVMNQSGVDFEMLVVDDGSTDDGPSIVSSLTKKFKNLTLIKLNRNYGYSTAKNVGIKESSGDTLVMLDADDMLLL